jgi:hypothetical protein
MLGIAFGSLRSSILPWWPDSKESVWGRTMEKSVLLPEDLSLESTKICLIYLGKEMKLTYEQMRMLAQLGPANDRIIVKNKKGHIIKPNIKWDQNERLKGTRYSFSAMQPRPSPAPSGSLCPVYQATSSSFRRRGVGKR